MNVNSIIQHPLDYSILDEGDHQVVGIAWTGRGEITEVMISLDNGESWERAKLTPLPDQRYS